ncbi:MAG TPA: pyrophosphate--fructose-6-phosphate 1-phosphotransferase [Candidatus Marinimicrobia bacterium]|jgi:pyrophosphate--fructose-6-phosphate 1-phosphotransferase|nr:pyrophosphate--fructose-6-phosphate 1-phosphotransferase [Candidatus Neomarinimicrobiota bacterium]
MKIAFLTSGGLAPCLSASIAALLESYKMENISAEFSGYLNGYQGLLKGKSYEFPSQITKNVGMLFSFGGSIIGNSRVKLTNAEDCEKRGLIFPGEKPLEKAAKQLMKDKISILHTIGGDDTNTMAAELSHYLYEIGYDLTVVGLPKTVDNDIVPIVQSLGADTAAEQGALFFENIVNENTSSPRQLIIHEVMGRHSGWLTAATAKKYRDRLAYWSFDSDLLLNCENWDIDAIFIPELSIDIEKEGQRLLDKMNKKDCVNIFLSEGACVNEIVGEMKRKNEEIKQDAFGHIRLDDINPGQWFARQFSKIINAEKTLVQKSGYFSRSAAPNEKDIQLIKESASKAVQCALERKSGVVGMDEKNNGILSLIEFKRIKGGRAFDSQTQWFQKMLCEIGQVS